MCNVQYWLCRVLVITCFALLPSAIHAGDFKVNRYFVIGDTLNDSGSGSQAVWATGNKPTDIYYRVTENNEDGSSRTWAGSFANRLGIDLKPYKINGVKIIRTGTDPNTGEGIYVAADPSFHNDLYPGGTNYAQMGSRVSGKSLSFVEYTADAARGVLVEIDGELRLVDASYAGFAAMSAVDQIEELKRNVNRFHKNDIISVWTGSNDAIAYFIAGVDEATSKALMRAQASSLADSIQSLRDRGARNILVLTLPVPSSPLLDSPAEGPLPTYYRTYNEQLKAELAGKDGLVIQTQKLADALRVRPNEFGLNLGITCNPATAPSALGCLNRTDPNQPDDIIPGGPYTRSDPQHPSNATHRIYADLVYASVKAASQNSSMTTATLDAIRQSGLALENRLLPDTFHYIDKTGKLAKRSTGDVRTFASISGGYNEEDSGQVNPGAKSNNASLNLGADIVLGKNAILGVSAYYNRSDVDFGDNSGGFDGRQIIGSLYANISVTNSIYINAALSAGHIDLNDITRKFNLNIKEEEYTGETDGNYKSARIGIGYNYRTDSWTLTPALAYTYEQIKINGYAESDGIGSLIYGDNELTSSRLSASFTARYKPQDPQGWSPMLRVSLEHDFHEDDMKVNLGFDNETMGALYLERPDGTYGTVTAGVSRQIGEETSFSVNATSIIGEEGITGASGTISIKSKF